MKLHFGILSIIIFLSSVFAITANATGSKDIVGVWTCKQTLHSPAGSDTDYFTETYNADGTNIFSDTGLNSQSVSFAPMGLYGSPAQGIWKKAGGNQFLRVATFLINAKLPAFDSVPEFIAGAPVARARVECINTLSKDGNHFSLTGSVSFTPLGNSPQLPPMTFEGQCERLTFK